MSSNTYKRKTIDGNIETYTRKGTQGRKPSGLAKPKLYRLDIETIAMLDYISTRLGYLYNENEIIRTATKKYVESVYTELLKQ
jgi:hypothetical protein